MKLRSNASDTPVLCYVPTMITSTGFFQADLPQAFALPLFLLQMMLILSLTRALIYLLKPLHQPRVVAEILAGVILGPSVLGRSITYWTNVFPLRSILILETTSNVGLLLFLFLVGLEMDITVMRQNIKESLTISVGGMILPFCVAGIFSFFLHDKNGEISRGLYVLFLGLALNVTAFPVVTKTLTELKLINTELGRKTMSTALVNNTCAWVLLTIGISLAESNTTNLVSLWVVLTSVLFVAFCVFVIRPCIVWVIQQTPEGESYSDFYICLILTGVMMSGIISDALGTHAVFGAFVFGLLIPKGPLSIALIEKLDDLVCGMLLPLFFAISGLKTNLSAIKGFGSWVILVLMALLSSAGKAVGTVFVMFLNDMSVHDGVGLGLLLNTKGLIEIIVLNVGRDRQVIDDETFANMVFVALVTTGCIIPLVKFLYRPTKRNISNKLQTIQKIKPDSEFRVLVCVHTPRNVPTIINLLQVSNATKRSPICVCVLHLVELTGRASAMLIVHNARKTGRSALSKTDTLSDHIIHAFENFEQQSLYVTVKPLTVVSPYSTIHDDIESLAENENTSLIIMPFHKHQTVDGQMKAANMAHRTINQNVLATAPCSVGLLVDRGLNGGTRLSSANQGSLKVAILFFGGPDDREALAYAWRVSENPDVNLTVSRFVPGEKATKLAPTTHADDQDNQKLLAMEEAKRQQQLDEEYIDHFKAANANYSSVIYIEMEVNNAEETIAEVRAMDGSHDLFIVGRGQERVSPLTEGLIDWSEYPELGPIGDVLASSDLGATSSVLVIQQHASSSARAVEFEEASKHPNQKILK